MQSHVYYRDQEDNSKEPYTSLSVRTKTSGGHRVHTGSTELLGDEQYLSVNVCKEDKLEHSPSRRRISAIPVCDKRLISRTWKNVFRSVNAKMNVSNAKARLSVASCTINRSSRRESDTCRARYRQENTRLDNEKRFTILECATNALRTDNILIICIAVACESIVASEVPQASAQARAIHLFQQRSILRKSMG